jgi:hypothetical protein
MSLAIKVASGQWRGAVTGRTYYAPRECQESVERQEQIENDKRAGILARQRCEGFENEMIMGTGPLSADKLRDHANMLANEAVVENAKRYTAPGVQMLINQWLKEHPDYDDGGEIGLENGKRAALVILGANQRSITPRSTAEIDNAMSLLAANGLLRVKGDTKMTEDQKYIASQIALRNKTQAAPAPEPEFDEVAAQSMSLSELRRRSGRPDPLGPQY